MVSKLCSRSQGQPSGARSRAMIPTRRSNLSPVVIGLVGIAGRWNSHCGTAILVCAMWLDQNAEWIGRWPRGVRFLDWVRFVIFLFVGALGSALPVCCGVSSTTEYSSRRGEPGAGAFKLLLGEGKKLFNLC